jgi:gliding motility-associated-like protein
LPIPSSLQATFELCSESVPLECQLLPFTVTGTATNICGSSSTTFVIAANVCNLKIPNVFTPNGDQFNSTFFIEGLDFYPRTKIQIFDRWGKEIYTSENYQNDWGPRDLSTGTYYYIIELPFGTTTLVEGHFTVLK